MQSLHGFLHGIKWISVHGHLIIFKNHLLEVGLTQYQEIMALQTLTTVVLYYFIICEDPHEQVVIEIAFGWGLGHIWLHTTLEGLWPHYVILQVSWDDLWTLSFGLSQFHGHGSWLVCEVAHNVHKWAEISYNKWVHCKKCPFKTNLRQCIILKRLHCCFIWWFWDFFSLFKINKTVRKIPTKH